MFRVTAKDGRCWDIEAETVEGAARHFAKLQYGGRAIARRTTGESGLSGYFQAYRPGKGSGTTYTSVGEPFHVRKA
jgi:hypothetical protein